MPLICQSCNAENTSASAVCHRCGCPYLKTAGSTDSKPNNVPYVDLLRGLVLSPVLVWVAFNFLQEGQAIISFSRRATGAIEVSGPWSSLMGAVAMLMAAVAFGSLVLDYIDTRANEHLYKRFLNWCFMGSGVFLFLAVAIGYLIEQIRWVEL